MSDSLASKTFWKCIGRTDWPDFIDIGDFIFNTIGILLTTLALVLISKEHAGPRVSLILLRGMLASLLLSVIVSLINDVYPYHVRTPSYHFNRAICLFWDSRFFYWIFSVMGNLFMGLFAVDRLFTMAQLDHFRVTLPEYRSYSYVAFAVVSSLLLSLPQMLKVNLEGDHCDCAPSRVNIPFLSLVYAHVFLWVSLLVFQGSLFLFISAQLIRWKLKRLPANHAWRTEDDLNRLILKQPVGTRQQTQKKEKKESGTAGRVKSHKWSSASLCIFPLTLSYVLCNLYDTTYQFISAIGLKAYKIGSREDRLGGLLVLIHSTTVPLILFFYIPSMRVYLKRLLKKVFKKKKKKLDPTTSQAGDTET